MKPDQAGKLFIGALAILAIVSGILITMLSSANRRLQDNGLVLDDLSARLRHLEAMQKHLERRAHSVQMENRPAPSYRASPGLQANRLEKALESLREGRFNDMVDEVARGAKSDADRAVKMAGHVCATVRNECENSRHEYSRIKMDSLTDPLTAWEYRLGLCGWRAQILVRALARMNIKAGIFNLYDYSFGHTCVVAVYDGKEHYFDPTYGGYFTDGWGNVLSWREIQAAPQAALKGMTVFPQTLDCDPDGKRTNHFARMGEVYTPEAIRAVKNAGIPRSRVFVLPVEIFLSGLSKGPVTIGSPNGAETDMRHESVHKSTRCWYLDSLGARHDNFAYSLNLNGLSGKRKINILLKFCKTGSGNAMWQASSKTGKILAGATGPYAARATEWLITYEPKGEGPQTVEIRLSQYRDKSFSPLDCITITSISA